MSVTQERAPQSALFQQLSLLNEQRRGLIPNIREYVQGQVEIWRQLPNWSLETEGRDGYSDSQLYGSKVYQPSHGVLIDLRNGKIKGSDEDILNFAQRDGALDAENHLNRFKTESEEPQQLYMGNPRKIAQWRADIRAQDPFLMETLDPSLSIEGQTDRLRNVISEIEEASSLPDSELTLEQVRNVIGHVLRASDFDDPEDGNKQVEVDIPLLNDISRTLDFTPTYTQPMRIAVRGAREVMQSVSFYIQTRSPQYTSLFAKLSDVIWSIAVKASSIVREERGLEHNERPEEIYIALGEENIKRDGGNRYSFSGRPSEPLRPDAIIGKSENLTAQKVADWFLNAPVEI